MCNSIACAKFQLPFPENGYFSKFNPILSPKFLWDHPDTWQALTRHNLEQEPPARIFI